ncbi:hypothetical protein CONPUDRAFT_118366, partial [Coniophora puteana RWD-64-598 SS2]
IDGIELKIANILSFTFFLGWNAWSKFGLKDKYYGDRTTYITPASWAFLIWHVIHLLLLGTIIYQFTPSGKRVIIDSIGWRFPLLTVLNTVFVGLRATHQWVSSFVFALLVYSSVTHIYYIVKKRHAAPNLGDEIYIHLPFSLWHAWSTFIVIVAAFEAFGIPTYYTAGIATEVLVFLSLLFLEFTAIYYAFSTKDGDLPGAVVIFWSIWAVLDRQGWRNDFIYWSAFGFAILSLVWIVRGGVRLFRRIRERSIALDEAERAPLLPDP